MMKHNFKIDESLLPVTMQQFEDLTNEMLIEINSFTAPQALDGNYMAKVVMSALHSGDKKLGSFKKSELFERCINIISNQITFHAVRAIEMKEEAEKQKNNPQPLAVVHDVISEDQV